MRQRQSIPCERCAAALFSGYTREPLHGIHGPCAVAWFAFVDFVLNSRVTVTVRGVA